MFARRTFTTAAMAGALALLACASTSLAQAQTAKPVKMAYALALNSHYGAGAQAWAAHVEKATNNAFKVQQFPSSALGGERELIEGLQLGTIEAILVSTGALSNFVPEVGVVDIPFLFRDTAHARKVFDGPIGQGLLDKFKQRGLIALAWGEQGFRHLSNNKLPVNTPADLKGLKIRTMENPVHLLAFRTLGAAPTPMAWPEVIGALQQGVIDGQENPLSVFVSAKLWQVQKNLTLTGHVYAPVALIVSPAFFNGLTDAQKTAFIEGAKIGAKASRDFVDDVEAKGVAEIKSHGVNVVTQVNKAPFQAALTPAYQQYAAKFGQQTLDQIAAVK